MHVLLGSGGFRTEERRRNLAQEMRRHFGAAGKILFLPYALADHDGYLKLMIDGGFGAGYELDGIHRHASPRRAVELAEGVYVGGGNTFRLLAELYRLDLLETLRGRVREGLPYLGVSAGTNVACPTIQTTNDMPITAPPDFRALGLVGFQINPHYFSGQTHVKVDGVYREHYGETRDDRIREYHEMNETPVLGLWEGGFVRAVDGTLELLHAPARLFRRSQAPLDLAPGARLESFLA